MKTSDQNYSQQQVAGEKLQMIILDPLLTSETDELYPKFSVKTVVPPDPDDEEEIDNYDDDDDFPAEEEIDYSDDIESDPDEFEK